MVQKTKTPQKNIQHDELILVVRRVHLFDDTPWTGMRNVDVDAYLNLIQEHKEFRPRSLMEDDPTFKQIIPYLIFEHDGRYFLMQRQAKATEKRLQSKYSLGIGGHIRQEDLTHDSLAAWAQREFEEEVAYDGNYTIEPIGLLNDDSNLVGEVHVGFVFILHGDSPNISVKEELKSGVLLPLDEVKDFYDTMETWSQIAFDHLVNNR